MGDDGPPGVGDAVRRDAVPYVVDVGPGSAGVRVVVRSRLPEGGATDILGELHSWADGVLTIVRRDGSIRTLAEADVLAAKRIPPPPARRP